MQEENKNNVAKQLVFQDERMHLTINVQSMTLKYLYKAQSNPVPSAYDLGLYWV